MEDFIVMSEAIEFYKKDPTAPMLDYKEKRNVYICDICTKCGNTITRRKDHDVS